MSKKWLSKLMIGIMLIGQIEMIPGVIAVTGGETTESETAKNEQKTPTIAPVIIGHEDDTEVEIESNEFTLKVTGEDLDKNYVYPLPDDLTVSNISGEVAYNKEKHALVFEKELPFNSDIKFISTAKKSEKSYTFDFGFNDKVSTVVTKVTINKASIVNREVSETDSTNLEVEEAEESETSETSETSEAVEEANEVETDNIVTFGAAANPLELGKIQGAEKSLNQDTMEDFPTKFNFTPKIYQGITKVGYNTTSANLSVNERQLTTPEMQSIQNGDGFYVYYKRAGIYMGRYIDVRWDFKHSPNINPNVRLKLHTALNSKYPNDIMLAMTFVFYESRINTEVTFIDSATKELSPVSGYFTYGNVDNTEYYAFDIDKIKNYVYSFSQNNLKYILATPDGNGITTNFGIKGQDDGMTTIDDRNTFTVMFEDQSTFPITYGYVKSGVGYAAWLGAIDINLLRFQYQAPIIYGDEEGKSVDDNLLEYRVIQENPSRGGGQTQIVLPDDYKINMEIEHYELLNTIKPSDISVKRLDTNTTITNQFDISVSDGGKITLNLKDVKNQLIQKDNFPSTMEIKFNATPKTDVKLSQTYQNIDGQGYYVFPIKGDLTYRQPAVEDDLILISNQDSAKIKTDDLPDPKVQKTVKNITQKDGLSRENDVVFIGDILEYEIKLESGGQGWDNIKLTDILPDTTLFRKLGDYELTLNGESLEVNEDIFDEVSNSLNMQVDDIPIGAELVLKYKLQVTGSAQGSNLVNKATITTSNEDIFETKATTNEVQMIPILNPEKPTESITVDNGTPGAQMGNLNLVYVPSFNFGEQKITNKTSEYQAKLLETADNQNMPNFVQIHDTLQDESGWKLSMSLGEFYDTKKANTLAGSELILKNTQYNNFNGLDQDFLDPLANEVTFTSGGDSNLLVQSSMKDDLQNTVIAFGNMADNTAKDSVTLRVPGSIKKVEDQYAADLDWQLQNVPE